MSEPLKNARHEAYARARALGRNQVEAYADAGYKGSPHTATARACQLNKRPDVRERVEYHLRIAGHRTAAQVIVNKNWVVQQLLEVYDRCMQAVPHYGIDRKPDGDWVFNARDALIALWRIGQELDMFENKIRVRHEREEIVAGTTEQIVLSLGRSIMRLGTPVARMVRDFLEEEIGPRTITITAGSDQPVSETGEATRQLLSAPSETG